MYIIGQEAAPGEAQVSLPDTTLLINGQHIRELTCDICYMLSRNSAAPRGGSAELDAAFQGSVPKGCRRAPITKLMMCACLSNRQSVCLFSLKFCVFWTAFVKDEYTGKQKKRDEDNQKQQEGISSRNNLHGNERA
ncbi:hypothetical protein EVAR_34397_1 [Eumeta japonica]|uniref:Uncharacterized protein n=1 Tax=Eumeta variegata TaxID=151549 RepID=A0A4C1WXD6_EUMVA|nr:hypothetical protein EVAR_34397_1 [Eumeta japonica]